MHLFKHRSQEYKLISKSKYFDKKWYLKTYPDVAAAKMDPVEHYLKYGWKEKRLTCENMLNIFPDYKSVLDNPLLRTNKIKKLTKKEYPDIIFPCGTKNLEYTSIKIHKKYKRLAVFASFSSDGKIHDYVVYYLKELRKVCDGIIFVSDNPLFESEILKIKELVIHIEAKRHKEYDFGSYKRGYLWAKENHILKNVAELVLCNDSVYGPFEPLKNMFDKMATHKCDFWGIKEGFDINRHLQSWFMVFKKDIIESGALESFLKNVKEEESFWDVVEKYELSLTEYLCNQNFICSSYMQSNKVLNCEQNIIGNTNIVEFFPLYCLKNKLSPFVKIKGCMCKKDEVLRDDNRKLINYIKDNHKTLYNYIKNDLYVRNQETYKYLFESESIVDLIKKAKVISFDCFDTLLERPYVCPKDLFVHMERFYDIKGFAEERISAEQRAHNNSLKKEISIDEIYDNILPKFKKYKQSELLFEQTLLKRVEQNYLLYKEAVKQNKPIVVISDMYLSDVFIKSVLTKNGYDNIRKVYVSSKYNATKGTGDLYRFVLQDFDLKPNELLHIGDNEHVDIACPSSMGITTFYVKKSLDKYAANYGLAKYYRFFNANPCLETSVLLSLIVKQSLKHKLNYWQQIGYAIAAPFIYGYLSKIENEVQKNKIDTLLFVARDGYLLQKYYNILVNKPVKNHYIYAPRILNLKCFGDWCDSRAYLVKYAKMLSKNIKQFVGVESEQDIKQSLEFYSDKIESFLSYNKSNYMRYLKKQNISGNRIASVDMTTGAFSSERFLSKIFQDKYKLGFFSASFTNKKNLLQYITFKNSVLSPQDKGVMEFLELLITSPEPPISDIHGTKVVYKTMNKHDKQRIEILKNIEFGVDMFIKDIKSLFITNSDVNLFQGFNFSMELIMAEIRNLCSHMSVYDKYKFETVAHSGDALNEDYVSLYQELMKYK